MSLAPLSSDSKNFLVGHRATLAHPSALYKVYITATKTNHDKCFELSNMGVDAEQRKKHHMIQSTKRGGRSCRSSPPSSLHLKSALLRSCLPKQIAMCASGGTGKCGSPPGKCGPGSGRPEAAQSIDQILLCHPDAPVADGEGPGLLVGADLDVHSWGRGGSPVNTVGGGEIERTKRITLTTSLLNAPPPR